MKRIDTLTAEPDLFGAGKDGFRDGETPATTASTRLNAAFMNALQEELVAPIETRGYVLDDDATQHKQLDTALENEAIARMFRANASYTDTAGATVVGICCMSKQPAGVALGSGTTDDVGNALAVCGVNMFEYATGFHESNPSLSTTVVTADLNAVSVRDAGTTRVFLAVGDAGKWARVTSSGSLTTGTIGAAPDLDYVQWCSYTSKWWAWGATGVWTASDAATPTWTQLGSAAAYTGRAVIPATSGNDHRVCMWNNTSKRIDYSNSPYSAFTAGLAEADGGGVIFDPSTSSVLITTATGWVPTEDGIAAGTEATGFASGDATVSFYGPVLVRNRIVLVYANNGGSEKWRYLVYGTSRLSASFGDWYMIKPANASLSGGIMPRGSGEFVAQAYGAAVYVSKSEQDVTGKIGYYNSVNGG